VLSDPVRRREYDALLAARSFQDRSSDPSASDNFFSQFAHFFSSAAFGRGQRPTKPEEEEATPDGERERERAQAFADGRPDAEGVFGNVFEEVSWKRCFVQFMDWERTDALFH
jgi:DnaJ-class molecular chaperone